MTGRKGFLVSLAAAVLAATAGLQPATAQVDNDDLDVYAFTGNATLSSVSIVGGSGSFSFSATTCDGLSTDDDTDELHVGSCSLTASGTYTNVVCGTGLLSGSGEWDENDMQRGDDAYTIDSFTAVLVAGIGVLEGSAHEHPGINDGEAENGTVVGVFVVAPTQPSTPVGCPSLLTVVGAVATNT